MTPNPNARYGGSILAGLACTAVLSGCGISSTNNPAATCGHGVAEVRKVESASEGVARDLIVCKGGYVYEVGES